MKIEYTWSKIVGGDLMAISRVIWCYPCFMCVFCVFCFVFPDLSCDLLMFFL